MSAADADQIHDLIGQERPEPEILVVELQAQQRQEPRQEQSTVDPRHAALPHGYAHGRDHEQRIKTKVNFHNNAYRIEQPEYEICTAAHVFTPQERRDQYGRQQRGDHIGVARIEQHVAEKDRSEKDRHNGRSGYERGE